MYIHIGVNRTQHFEFQLTAGLHLICQTNLFALFGEFFVKSGGRQVPIYLLDVLHGKVGTSDRKLKASFIAIFSLFLSQVIRNPVLCCSSSSPLSIIFNISIRENIIHPQDSLVSPTLPKTTA